MRTACLTAWPPRCRLPLLQVSHLMQLQRAKRTLATHHKEVTVMFADVVGFTAMCNQVGRALGAAGGLQGGTAEGAAGGCRGLQGAASLAGPAGCQHQLEQAVQLRQHDVQPSCTPRPDSLAACRSPPTAPAFSCCRCLLAT